MKILFIAHDRGLGGATSSLLNIIECINRIHPEYEIHVLVPTGELKYKSQLEKLNCRVIQKKYYLLAGWPTDRSRMSVLLHRVKWLAKEKLSNNVVAIQVAHYAKKHGIDIIHSNSSIIDIGALISKYSGIPHIWHFREFLQEDQNAIMWCSQSYFNGLALKHTKQIIAVSKAVKTKYDDYFGEKIKVVYNGVPQIKERENIAKKNDDRVNIIEVGKVCTGKGQDVTLKAMAQLVHSGCTNIRLLLIGNPEFDFGKSLYNEIHEYVDIVGQKDITEVNRIRMELGDIEVVSSKAEAFGRVTVEAMMCGLPVVGSNSGGTPELIENNVTGVLYTQGDYNDLAEKLRMLIENKELRTSIGNRAKSVVGYYSIERCVEEILDIYRLIM